MRFVAAGAACVAAALLAAAAYPAQEGERPLRVAYFANVGHAIPAVGIERGFFEAELGRAPEARVFDSGPQAIEAMFAGSVDAAYVGPGPAINGHINSEGGDIRIFAGAASGGASFVAHPASDVEGVHDFGGRRIAAPQIGNTQDVSLRHALAGHGLAPAERGGTVTVYNVPNPDIHTLFAKGDVDGAWVAEPWATMLVEMGGERLFYEEELWPGGEFASVLLVASSEYARENPAEMRALLRAHNQTAEWIASDPRGARDAFNAFLESHLGRPLPDRIVDEALANTEITADPKPASVAEFAERAGALGYLGRHGHDISGIWGGAP